MDPARGVSVGSLADDIASLVATSGGDNLGNNNNIDDVDNAVQLSFEELAFEELSVASFASSSSIASLAAPVAICLVLSSDVLPGAISDVLCGATSDVLLASTSDVLLGPTSEVLRGAIFEVLLGAPT